MPRKPGPKPKRRADWEPSEPPPRAAGHGAWWMGAACSAVVAHPSPPPGWVIVRRGSVATPVCWACWDGGARVGADGAITTGGSDQGRGR
jgi:hypothetical protein